MGEGPHTAREGGAALSVFLSLFLLMLAFFIVLTAASSFEENRAQAVLESVNAAFAGRESPDDGHSGPRATGRRGDVIAQSRSFQDRLSEILDAEIPAVKIARARSADRLEARFRIDSLFIPDLARLRSKRNALVQRLASAVATPPAGLAVDMEFRLGTDYRLGRVSVSGTPFDPPTQRARAGVFARALVEAGAPAAAVAIAMAPGDPAWATLAFRLTAARDAG